MNTYVAENPRSRPRSRCVSRSLFSRADLQSVGVAAPRMAREFGLSVSQMGIAFSAGTFGLLPGAMLGGRLADRIGRKRVLIASVVLFGLLSIATAQVSTFAMLVVVRVLTGIGLGGAMPNLIALSSEAVEPRSRSSAVATMYCGIPFGGVIASLIGVLLAGDTEWRHIFYVGGVGPLLLVPLLVWFLPESRAYLDVAGTQAARTSVARTLFGDGRTTSTVALWVSYFCTLIVLYFLLNWLPSLMASRGSIARTSASCRSRSTSARRCARHRRSARPDACVARGGRHVCRDRAVARRARGRARLRVAAAAAFAAGMFVVGGQSVLYALAAIYYPTAMRGTGVGAAVAVGRLGSVVGPLAAATLLAAGRSAPVVIGASIPVTLVAAFAAFVLIRRPQAGD